MRCQRDVSSACGRRRPALRRHASRSAAWSDATESSSATCRRCLRPSARIAARLRRRDGRWARWRKTWLPRGSRHAQYAAAGRVAVRGGSLGGGFGGFVVGDCVFASGLVILCDHGGLRGIRDSRVGFVGRRHCAGAAMTVSKCFFTGSGMTPERIRACPGNVSNNQSSTRR